MYDTYHYRCPKCFARVQITPTNANRMLYVVCTGRETSKHEPEKMRQEGIVAYRTSTF